MLDNQQLVDEELVDGDVAISEGSDPKFYEDLLLKLMYVNEDIKDKVSGMTTVITHRDHLKSKMDLLSESIDKVLQI